MTLWNQYLAVSGERKTYELERGLFDINERDLEIHSMRLNAVDVGHKFSHWGSRSWISDP